MSKKKSILKVLNKIVANQTILNWTEDIDGDDFNDALDHINLMRNRNFQQGYNDLELKDKKTVDPKELLPVVAFKSKPYGWLKEYPKNKWINEFKKVYDRDISHILKASENEGINSPIVIDNEIADGIARTKLAYSLGEKLPVAFYRGIK